MRFKVPVVTVTVIAVAGLLLVPVLAAQQQTAETAERGQEEVTLITGLDGAPYEAYVPSAVEGVQTALRNEGFYDGEVDGELDEETMQAIGEFQKQHGVYMSGVPSPETRERLLDSE